MKEQDYIKSGIELADDWRIADGKGLATAGTICCPLGTAFGVASLTREWKAALAAQLVRQVDAIGGADKEFISALLLNVFRDATSIDDCRTMPPGRYEVEGPDRTMNTIKVVVDSKVLK